MGFSIFSSGGHFVQRSRTILASLEKLHWGIIRMKLFWNRPIGLGENVVLQVFLFLALAAIFSAEQNHFSNFGKRSSKEHSCDIILKSAHWPRRRCCLKGFFIFSSDGHFVQQSGTILAILGKGLQGNICVKLFWNWTSGLGGDVLWMNCWRHTTDDGWLTTNAGHRVITIAHLEHLVLRWAKKFTPPPPTTTTPPPEKQYICLASASQARQKAEGETKVCCQTGYRTQDPWLKSQVPYRLRYATRLKKYEYESCYIIMTCSTWLRSIMIIFQMVFKYRVDKNMHKQEGYVSPGKDHVSMTSGLEKLTNASRSVSTVNDWLFPVELMLTADWTSMSEYIWHSNFGQTLTRIIRRNFGAYIPLYCCFPYFLNICLPFWMFYQRKEYLNKIKILRYFHQQTHWIVESMS